MIQFFASGGRSTGASASTSVISIHYLVHQSVQFSCSVLSNSLQLHGHQALRHQASLSIANSQSLLKLMSIESVTPSNHLIFCRPLLFSPSIFPSIRVFSNDTALRIRWTKYWRFQLQHQSFQLTVRTDFPLGWTGWISLQSMGLSRVFSNTTVQKYQFFGAQFSL